MGSFLLRAICLSGILASFAQLCLAQEDYHTRAVNLHNEYRTKHHSPDLQLDDDLNGVAQRCAEYYANRKKIDHTCHERQDRNLGENLSGGSGANSRTDNAWTDTTVKMWYDEEAKYDYDNPGFSGETGHFTQVVWKSSERLGLGIARNGDYIVGVGVYDPAGN